MPKHPRDEQDSGAASHASKTIQPRDGQQSMPEEGSKGGSTVLPATNVEFSAEAATPSHGRGAIADMDWYISNLRQLVQTYPDHWLAIVNQQVIAAAPDTRELRQHLDELGIKRGFVGRSHPDAISGPR